MSRVLFRDVAWVLTLDPERRVIRDGAVAVADGRIAAVGKSDAVAAGFAADEVIDARGMLLLPGLIDTHVHNAQQLGRGLAEWAYSAERLLKRLWALEAAMDADDALCAARLCQVELIRAGVTCFADPGSYFPRETAQAVRESGLRGVIARTAFDVTTTSFGAMPPAFCETRDAALAASEEVVRELHGALGGRLRAWFSMRVPIACTDELLRRLAALATRHGVGLIGHAAENRDEFVASHVRHGMGDVTRLERLGVLGPNVLLLHVGWLHPEELLLLKRRDVKVSVAPSTSLHQGMGNLARGRAPEMLALGVTVSLGSDSAMSGNFLDPIRQAFAFVGGYREARLDNKAVRPEHAVEGITLMAARALGWDTEIGSLEVGKRADLTLLSLNRPEWQPVHDPVANLVFSGHGGAANTVMVDGRFLMRDGRVLTLDEQAIYREATGRAAALARRAGLPVTGALAWPVV